MPGENKNLSQTGGLKPDPQQVKKLENDLKNAFKDDRFKDVKMIASQLKMIDPENHLADYLSEKADKIFTEQVKKANADKIKFFEKQLNEAFKQGKLLEIAKIAGEIKKVDPENKVVKEIETRIDKAKAALDKQVKKEKIKNLEGSLKELLKNNKWDDVVSKANELLKLDEKNSDAMKALIKVANEKKADVKNLINLTTVTQPQKTAEKSLEIKKKPGFFARLFGWGEEVPAKIEVKPDIKKPLEKMQTISMAVPKKEGTKPIQATKPATLPVKKIQEEKKEVDIQKAQKEQIKLLENNLEEALEEKNNFAIKSAIDTLIKADPENKSAKKAQVKLDEEKEKLEKEARKEKIDGLTNEIKEFMKNEEWDKTVNFANELLKVEWNNSLAVKALKKAAEAKNVQYDTLVKVTAPKEKETKLGFFAGLFGEKAEVQKEELKEPVKPIPAMPIKTEARVTPTPSAKTIESAKAKSMGVATPSDFFVQRPSMIKPEVPKKEEAAPSIPTLKPAAAVPQVKVEPIAPAPLSAVKKPMEAQTVAKALETKQKTAPETAKPKETESEKGNIFTKLFGKKVEPEKPTESIIETIVSQAEQGRKVTREFKAKEEGTAENFVKFSNLFLRFSVVFIVLSAAFFYVTNIDEDNLALSMLDQKNNAIQLKNAAESLRKSEKDKTDIQEEITRYEKGYENEYKTTIDIIKSKRIDWPDLIRKLNEVTESVYEKNALAQYVQYNNYSYDVADGKLTVSATLSDPLGKNLTKLAELEEAFTYYPKDKNDPNDKTTPYFQNLQEFRSYAKSFNKATGRYTSNFTLSLSTKIQTNK